jgi:plastocyanin/uncharacterized membrane protein
MSASQVRLLLIRVVAGVSALSIISIYGAAHSGGTPAPATHTVVIKQMHFDPAEMTVNAGDTIEWKNEDIFSHTVTANDGSFDSGLIAPGQSWKTVVKKAGTIGYHCRPHTNMTASLVVLSGAQPGTHGAMHPGGGGEAHGESLRWALPSAPRQIHPILVNFTAALLPLSLLSDILGQIFSRQSLHNAAWWMVLYTAAITPFTAAAGWWWKYAEGPTNLPAQLITVHQWLGTTAAVAFIILAAWRWRFHKRGTPPAAAYLACALVAVLALVYQGSLGGTMVFGR